MFPIDFHFLIGHLEKYSFLKLAFLKHLGYANIINCFTIIKPNYSTEFKVLL